jgi:hypothetical protein
MAATTTDKITLVSNDGIEVQVGKSPSLRRTVKKPTLTLNNRSPSRRALHAHQEHDGGSRRCGHDPKRSYPQCKHLRFTFTPPRRLSNISPLLGQRVRPQEGYRVVRASQERSPSRRR